MISNDIRTIKDMNINKFNFMKSDKMILNV